jgi:hypothetical protein
MAAAVVSCDDGIILVGSKTIILLLPSSSTEAV